MSSENGQSSATSASRCYASCPRCSGSGEVTVVFVTAKPRSCGMPMGEYPCDACDGTGQVTCNKLHRMKRGESLRHYRVKVCGLGLREAARLWNIKAVDLSRIEQGLVVTNWAPPGFVEQSA